jgi:hypothetical protein
MSDDIQKLKRDRDFLLEAINLGLRWWESAPGNRQLAKEMLEAAKNQAESHNASQTVTDTAQSAMTRHETNRQNS